MKVGIITIGDELLIGQVVNTNAAFIGEALQSVGASVLKTVSVGDDHEAIKQELEAMQHQANVIIVTGGLGPTHDDVTKHAIADFLGRRLVINEEALTRCQHLFERRGIPMPKANISQGEVIEGSEVLQNEYGTAPGMLLNHILGNKMIIILPGVPREMEQMLTKQVLTVLKKISKTFIKHCTLLTTGIGESSLAEKIGHPEEFLGAKTTLAFLPNATSGVRLRLSTKDISEDAAQQENERVKQIIVSKIAPYIYSENGDVQLENAIAKAFTERGLTIATAESCTGGLVAHRLTNIDGASTYFMQGVVVYSNEAKIRLGVKRETLAQHDAVSEEVAIELAQSVRKYAETDIGVGITGIAGPSGGTKEKPVGLVWIGIATASKLPARATAKRFTFLKDRVTNKELFSQACLNMILEALKE